MVCWLYRRVIEVVVLFVILTISSLCTNHAGVDGAKRNLNTNTNHPGSQHVTEEANTNSHWFTSEQIAKDSINPEIAHLKQQKAVSKCDRYYMLVSTIDGRVSALDLHRKGSLVWSVQADSRPLYSSSLTSMEMIHNGKKMRLIPSLDGALYQFDGDKVEAVPLSAESLLSSTYKLSDDSMIVGSKDMKSFGINLNTGEIQFTCGSEGCSNSQEKSKDKSLEASNFLILTRSTQVVRSVDIKNGHEKWNFSVGQHQITLPPTARPSEINDTEDVEYSVPHFKAGSDECSNKERYNDATSYENLLQLLVSDGLIKALNKRDSNKLSWEYKFDCPIANAWLLRHNEVEAVDLFDGDHIPSLNTYTPEIVENENVPQPLLYIGSHQKLPYIQASLRFESVLKTFTNHRIGHFIDPNLKVSWRPYLNTASVRTPIFMGNRPQITCGRQSSGQRSKKESTSLTVWHEQYPFDTGYFLYPEFCCARSLQRRSVMLIEDLSAVNEANKSWLKTYPWLYWKEVVMISLGISLCVHIFVTRFLSTRHNTKSLDASTSDASKDNGNSHEIMMTSISTSLLSDRVSTSGQYVSRFATDFDCLHCLGKGGFGVVFEAVNKVDDQHYAIKRIMLPKSEGAKEKVLREVKALAKLEHIGIVRYFNAWVESPPTGWQEERDKQFHFTDASGSTSYTNTASHIEWNHPKQNQFAHNTEFGEKGNRSSNMYINNVCSFRPGTKEETQHEASIFSAQISPSVHILKQSGSEEFSVHSNHSEADNDRSENGFTNSRENVFLFEVNAKTKDFTTDNSTNSKSSIPFSNYSFSSSELHSHFADYANNELSGDSIVFESTSNKSSHDSFICDKTKNSSFGVVFKNNVESGDNHTDENGQCLYQSDQVNSVAEYSLSSIKKDNEGNAEENISYEESLSGTKFFLYIQMQLYRKETLKEWLSSNTLNRDRHTVLDIFDQIVCAVDYVHRQGLMHRDLKPSNIFFTADETVKVGDFGLVTALSVQHDQEYETGQKSPGKHTAEVGTTLYMSPEQISRRPYDLKIDIFSLGLIFLELLIPFTTQMERIRTLQDAKKQVFPLRFNRELPLESELVHKMTDSDPELRPGTDEILYHPLLQEFAPTRIGTRLRSRTISNNSIG